MIGVGGVVVQDGRALGPPIHIELRGTWLLGDRPLAIDERKRRGVENAAEVQAVEARDEHHRRDDRVREEPRHPRMQRRQKPFPRPWRPSSASNACIHGSA